MKRILIKIIGYFILVLAILISMNLIYVPSNNHKKKTVTHIKDTMNDQGGMVFLGASQSIQSVDVEKIEHGAFHLSLNGQSVYYSLEMLKEYSDHLLPDCVVMIDVKASNYGEDKNSKIVSNYFSYLPYWRLEKPLPPLKDYILGRWFPARYYFSDFLELISGNESKWRTPYWYRSKFHYDNLSAFKSKVLEISSKKDANKIGKSIYDDQILLDEIVQHCVVHGFQPIFITYPLHEFSNENLMKKGHFDEFDIMINEFKDRYGILYLDYYKANPFYSDYTLFKDTTHLNVKGREIFTEMLLDDLEENGIIIPSP